MGIFKINGNIEANNISASGTISAISFIGDLDGNAATATKLKTARTISLTGSVTGSGSFDGSGNLSIATTTNHTHSYLPLSGGQMSGPIYMGSTSTADGPSIVFFSNKRNYIWMGYANDNGSWYIWDRHNSKGIISSDVNGNNTFYGNSASATRWALKGGSTVYTGDSDWDGALTDATYYTVYNQEWGSTAIGSNTGDFSIGETDNCKTPLAVSGRVLAYYDGDINDYEIGDTVCATVNGLITKMTREEIKEYPDRIVGTVSEIPSYDTWGSGNVPTAGRIWIKVR